MVPKILIVEDFLYWRNAITKLLQPKGYHLVYASGAVEAKHCLSSNHFDLVITNLILDKESPLLDGLEVLSEVNRLGTNTRCIVISDCKDYQAAVKILNNYRHIVAAIFAKSEPWLDAEAFLQKCQEALSIGSSFPGNGPNSTRISWLHLSDLHIGHTDQARDWADLKKALLEDIQAHQIPGPEQPGHCAGVIFHPDLILITGDVAWTGTKEEYREAEGLLKSIWSSIGLGEDLGIIRTFIVPGNHDLRRTVVETDELWSTAYGELADPNATPRVWLERLLRWWDNADLRKLWKNKFSAYLQFSKRCSAVSTQLGFFCKTVSISDVKVNILGLNSALMSWKDGEDRERGLWIGKPQWEEIEQMLPKDSAFRISLVHHPHEALHPQDSVWEKRLQRVSHIILHGHLHEQRAVFGGEPEHEHICLPSGSVYQGGIWERQRYSYGQVDLKARVLDLYLRMTEPGAFPRYIRDTLTYPSAAPDGHLSLPLPEKPHL